MTVKLLMISLGSIGRRHLRNARALLPEAEIAVHRTTTQGSALPEGADLQFDTLAQAQAWRPELVFVNSPAPMHLANAAPFIKQGASLFIEKPLSGDLAGLAEFETLVETASGFVMVGYVLRFSSALHAARRALDEGAIGRPLLARVEAGQYLPDWRPASNYRDGVSAQKALGGGALLELSHEIDYAIWLMGAPDGVTARVDKLSDLDIDVEDAAGLLLDYASPKQLVSLHLDFLQRTPQLGLQIVGTEGTLQADLLAEKTILLKPSEKEGTAVRSYSMADGNEIYLRQFDLLFYKALKEYAPRFAETKTHDCWADVAGSARVLRLIDAARRSSDGGDRIVFGG